MWSRSWLIFGLVGGLLTVALGGALYFPAPSVGIIGLLLMFVGVAGAVSYAWRLRQYRNPN
ncbi:MAG: hypothetical protein ACHQ50_10715 [Fimbriimonadales bacterium]